MQRRRMVVKRLDPWSVLKFSFLLNLAFLAMLLLAGRVVWFAIRQLGLIDTVCDQASQILDLTDCGIDGGGLFQNAVVLGLFGVVVMTGFAVFLTFLLNLISDLTGGIGLTVADEVGLGPAQPGAATTPHRRLSFSRSDVGDDRDTASYPRPPVPPIAASPAQGGPTPGSLVGAAARPGPPVPPAEATSASSTSAPTRASMFGGAGSHPSEPKAADGTGGADTASAPAAPAPDEQADTSDDATTVKAATDTSTNTSTSTAPEPAADTPSSPGDTTTEPTSVPTVDDEVEAPLFGGERSLDDEATVIRTASRSPIWRPDGD